MQLLFDFFPILLFFGAYKVYGIMTATAVAMGASVLQVGWSWFRHHKVENSHLFSAALIIVFGGATLVLADERFIKVKPTILYVVLALVFLGSLWSKRTMAERMFSSVGEGIPVSALRLVNLWWVGFFSLLAGLNYYVATHYDTDTWVNFKLFGLLGLTLVFVLGQAFYLAKVSEDVEDPDGSGETEVVSSEEER